MAGVGQSDEPLVSAGAAAQPLVTSPDLSITGSPAVANLVDAFHKGFVTADDIVNRIGTQATAQKQASLEALKEFVDPNMIEARMSAAKLQAAQNEAQQSLVAPSTQLGAATIAKNIGMLSNGDAVNLGQQWFGTVKDDQGNPDWDATANLGRSVYRQQLRLQQAQQGLAVTQKYNAVEKGQTVEHWLNALGEDVSPGTPAHQAYAQMRQDAWNDLYATPGTLAKPTSSGATAAPSAPTAAPTASLVTPLSPGAAPAAAPPVVQPTPTIGVPLGPAAGFFQKPEEIRGDLEKQKTYELWEQQKKFAQSFDSTAKRIEDIPAAQQKSGGAKMNALDIALAESIIKLYDPGMAIREFKWDKLAEAQPYLEKLPNWRAEFLHTGTLTPQGRERLIQMGYDNIDGADTSVKPHIDLAAQRSTAAGISPMTVLNSDELRVLKGEKFGTARPGTPTTAQPGTPGATKSSGAVVFQSGPYAGRSMIPNGDGTYRPQ